jgi:hypothetical protein
MKKTIFPPSLLLLLLLVFVAVSDRAEANYCHNDPVNKVDVLGMAEVVTTTPGGNGVLVNNETSFWLVYSMMADAGLVAKLDPWKLGAKPTFADAMLVAGKLGGTVKDYPKAWPWAATGAASPNDLWIMPGSASLPGNPGGHFDAGIIGMQAGLLTQGKGFYLDAIDVRAIQAAGEATSDCPWGSLSDYETQILGDRGAVLSWWDTPLATVGGGNGRDEYKWGGAWGVWEPSPGPRGLGYAMRTTPFGTPRLIHNMLIAEIASAGLAKGFGAFRAFANGGAGLADDVFTHGLKYDPRIRVRGVQDGVGHNFPYSFDAAILRTDPIALRGGAQGYAMRGIHNGKDVVFNIVVKDGVVTHRDFVSAVNWGQRSRSFGFIIDYAKLPGH